MHSPIVTAFLFLASIASLPSSSYSFSTTILSPAVSNRVVRRHCTFVISPLSASSAEEQPEGERKEEEEEEEVQYESVVRINDGGSDLTDRFKYKVNALMGNYDPKPGTTDDEYQNGNILNAMLTFPTSYTFTVVGKTNNDETQISTYVKSVKKVMKENTSIEEEKMECRITPRGKKFTRVSIAVTVESAAMITGIYDGLEDIDETVMRY